MQSSIIIKRGINIYLLLIFLLVTNLSLACSSPEHKSNNTTYKADTIGIDIKKVWFDGNAELATYDLVQPRYGENRKGHAVIVTVTEDFSKVKQVKLDNALSDLDDVLKVLKTIVVRRFITGIYDYSLMTSTFVPFNPDYKTPEEIYPVKITHSTQDWCGQSFSQLNNRDNRYIIETKSYYEIEGDHTQNIIRTYAMDGLFAIGRIDPKRLPTGEFKILPALGELHLNHWTTKPRNVIGELKETEEYFSYSFESNDRQLRCSIAFRKTIPYIVERFYVETDGKRSTYKLSKLERLPYWGLNAKKNEDLRKKLAIPWVNN